MQKKIISSVIAALLLGCVAYAIGSPYLAVRSFRHALAENDLESLRDHVDFPALRESVKAQLNAEITRTVAADLSDNPFAALGSALAGSLVDRLVENLVTAEGLAQLAGGQAANIDAGSEEPHQNMGYKSTDRFEVGGGDTAAPHGGPVMVFRRSGIFNWKLTSIRLPSGWLAQSNCQSKQSGVRRNLKMLWVAEESFRVEYDKYTTDKVAVGFEPRPASTDYDFVILSASKSEFVAEARGTGPMTGDLWRIDQSGKAANVTDLCTTVSR